MADKLDTSLTKQIDEIIKDLSPSQKKALAELAISDTLELPAYNRSVKKILPKDLIHECEVRVECKLCGTVHISIHRSSSKLSSRMPTPSCGKCRDVLLTKSVEELVQRLIDQADGDFKFVKQACVASEKKLDEASSTDEGGNDGDSSCGTGSSSTSVE